MTTYRSDRPDYVHPVFQGMPDEQVQELVDYSKACAARLGCPPDLVEDAAQEAMLLLMTWASFGPLVESKPMARLRTHWATSSAVRRVTRHEKEEDDVQPDSLLSDTTIRDELARMVNDESALRLWDSLSKREQAILNAVMSGRSIVDIERELGLGLHVANETLVRLRKRVKEERWGEPGLPR